MNELLPQYAIFVDEEKGDYEATHLWFKDRKAFDYFSIFSYYPTKDFIYLIGSKGEEVYTYCYNKKDGGVRLQKRQSAINEQAVPWFSFPFLGMKRSFVLNNDLCGGDFTVDSRSSGKYWIDVLDSLMPTFPSYRLLLLSAAQFLYIPAFSQSDVFFSTRHEPAYYTAAAQSRNAFQDGRTAIFPV